MIKQRFKMKNKVLLKSLFHIAKLVEQAQELTKKKIIVDAFNDYSYTDFSLYTDCIETGNSLYNKKGIELADSGLMQNSYYKDTLDTMDGYPYYEDTRYYKIKDGVFVGVTFYDSITINTSPELLNTIFKIAILNNKINKILARPQVVEVFEDIGFNIDGFEYNCTEKNGLLYHNNGNPIAEGDKYSSTGMIDDLYYVDQHTGYLEDDYYGIMYYKISDGLFVKIEYSC